MSNDLISRKKLRLVIRNVKETAELFSNDDYRVGYISALSLVEGLLADAPAVDAEPVRRGSWENVRNRTAKTYLRSCSACGKECYFCGIGCSYKYCPNCGAKMDGGNEE